LLPARSKVRKVKHHAALPYAELPAFMPEQRAQEGVAARALEFLVLTATRNRRRHRRQAQGQIRPNHSGRVYDVGAR
jgi:hypothetical protein